MRAFVIFMAALIASAQAGTRLPSPGEASRAESLWAKYCADGRDGGKDNGIFIHCKHPLGQEVKILRAVIDVNSNVTQREQYIFVQPAPLHFNHDLTVHGGPDAEPKTIIYVKPAKTSHTYNGKLELEEGQHPKPELVFLGSENTNTGGGGAFPVRLTTTTTTARPKINPAAWHEAVHGIALSSKANSDPNHIVI